MANPEKTFLGANRTEWVAFGSIVAAGGAAIAGIVGVFAKSIDSYAGSREISVQRAYDDGLVADSGPNKPVTVKNSKSGKISEYILHISESRDFNKSVIAFSCDGPSNILVRDISSESVEALPGSTWNGVSPACMNGALNPQQLNENGNDIYVPQTATK